MLTRQRLRLRGPTVEPERAAERLRDIGPWASLNMAAVLWGSQHAVVKQVIEQGVDPAWVNLGRFGAGALVFWLVQLGRRVFVPDRDDGSARAAPLADRLRLAIELGVWMFLGYAFQSVGLQTTTAARSGFLLYMNVKLVPIFAAIFLRRRIAALTWLSAAVAFAGTVLLSYDGAPPNVGDAWSLAAAVASALFILRLECAAAVMPPIELNAWSLSTVTLCSALWMAAVPDAPAASLLQHRLPDAVQSVGALPILYLGLVTTALGSWLQAVGQEHIPAEQAAILYALDPVYGALFAYVLLDEQLGAQGWLGAVLIVVAALVSQRAARNGDGGQPTHRKG